MDHYGYEIPKTVSEACALLRDRPRARFIAGGTDLLVQVKKKKLAPETLISLRQIDELRQIEVNGRVRIGAMAPLSDVAAHAAVSELFPALAAAIRCLGSPQIRNLATLGGNLCNASPAADSAPPLLVYGASVELRSAAGSRELPLDQFFRGPGATALQPGELLGAVLLERPSADCRGVFLRQGRVSMDLAIANLAALLELRDGVCRRARIAVGAVAPTPRRLTAVEQILEQTELTPDAVARAQQRAIADVSPIDDLRSSADYRRQLVGIFVQRAVEQALAGRRGGSP